MRRERHVAELTRICNEAGLALEPLDASVPGLDQEPLSNSALHRLIVVGGCPDGSARRRDAVASG